MNIKRFHAATSREALAKARMAFGEGTLILSNRPTATGVEVVATAEETLHALNQDDMADAQPQPGLQTVMPSAAPSRSSARAPVEEPLREPTRRTAPVTAPPVNVRRSIEADTEQLAMSTLSFQDYVRERMLRRRHEAMHGKSPQSAPEPMEPLPAPTFVERARNFEQERNRELQQERLSPEPRMAAERPQPSRAHAHAQVQAPAQGMEPAYPSAERARELAPAAVARHNPLRSIPMDLALETQRPMEPALSSNAQQGVMNELQSMKELIEERFNTLTWLGQARQNPIQTNLMLKLIRAGYSPALSRAVLERLPEDLGAAEAVRWLMDVLERNLTTDAQARPLYDEGGIFALVGATGVGKTTTTAKLAALCARQYGPGNVGLITLDTYRVGAHEQLRSFGRMLGVVAHLAHDRAALQDLLGLLSGKKMVLIDTTGVAPRDPRKRDMLEVLELPDVQRLLVLNAGAHGDTLDDALEAFKTNVPQQVILSKVDEAVKLGPAVDALVRHQATLRGVTNGQRVPEDWEAPDAHQLVAQSMRAPSKSAFDPKSTELNFFFSMGTERGAAHA